MVKPQASPVSVICSNRLTLHAQTIRAVLGLQDEAVAVLASVLGRGCRALPPAPVRALGPASRPLAPWGPPAIHCHTKTSIGSKAQGAFWGQRGAEHKQKENTTKHWRKRAPEEHCIHFNCWSPACSTYTVCGLFEPPLRGVWLFLHWPGKRKLNGTHRNQSCHQELHKRKSWRWPFFY